MRRAIAALAVLGFMGLSAGAWASPSLVGPTGLLLTPTADVMGMASWNAGGTAIWPDAGSDVTVLYANVGIFPRLEVGLAYQDIEDVDSETLVNAKFHVLSLPGRLTMSVGAIDITDQIDRSLYVVASHDLGAGVIEPRGTFSRPRVHGGVGGGRFDDVFLGFSVTVSGQADLLAEYDGDDVNVGVRWPIIPTMELTGAALGGLDDYAVGLSFVSPW